MTETIEGVPDRINQQQLAQQLVDAARVRRHRGEPVKAG